EELLID
ncbi:hypothetical protein ACN38_g11513, partial [Penicillium nordicum]